jgi:hypothetical protein
LVLQIDVNYTSNRLRWSRFFHPLHRFPVLKRVDAVEKRRSLRARDFAWKNDAIRRALSDRWQG